MSAKSIIEGLGGKLHKYTILLILFNFCHFAPKLPFFAYRLVFAGFSYHPGVKQNNRVLLGSSFHHVPFALPQDGK